MDELGRAIGRLEAGQLAQNDRLASIEDKQDKMDVKIDRLHEFRWRVAGGAAVLAVLLTAAAELYQKYGG